jgi:hypothetical protein
MIALNPNFSRFTLSIPLLGEAKVPLDSILGLRDSKKKDEGMFQGDIIIG